MLLLKNADAYTPDSIGIKDILIINEKVVKIADNIDVTGLFDDIKIIDLEGRKAVPGLIDQHVHTIGTSGSGSFCTRGPEIKLSTITKAGVTTVVGLLGSDGITKNVHTLYAKTKALNEEGITSYMLTGSYEYPTRTLLGDVVEDFMYINEIIGTKLCIADHRSSEITLAELKRLASQNRMGALLTGKAGIVTLHLGDSKNGINMLFEIMEKSDIPIRHFMPTHMNRNSFLFKQGIEYAKLGGYIDISTGVLPDDGNDIVKTSRAIVECLANDVDSEKILMSSDGHGGCLVYDPVKKQNVNGVCQMSTMLDEVRDLVFIEKMELPDAVAFASTNVAKALNIYPNKGTIRVGSDGDILVFDDNLNVDCLIARGNVMICDKKVIRKGTYEDA